MDEGTGSLSSTGKTSSDPSFCNGSVFAHIVCVGVSVGRTLSRQRFRGVTEEAGAITGGGTVAHEGDIS